MKTALFIVIVLISGCFAGVIHGLTNLALVEPYLDEAIGIENQKLFASGNEDDSPEFWAEYTSYRVWQKGGQILAGSMLGTSVGALFGIVFAFSRNSLPLGNNMKKGLILAGIMWMVLYVIPFLKYPANPPTVGDPDTILLRTILYLSFIAISGFGALGFYQLFKKLRKGRKIFAIFGFGAFMVGAYLLMPSNPDEISAPLDLVNGFRIMSFVAVTVFWISLGIIVGLFWQKYQPDKKIHAKID